MYNEKIEKSVTIFNEQEFFDKTIAPKITEIQRLCAMKKIPMFFTAAIKSDENETIYYDDGVMTGSAEITLVDDRLRKHLMVAAGCAVVRDLDSIEIMMEDPDDL